MALQPCRECGTEVSTQAEACPNCGCPTRSETTRGYLSNSAGLVFYIFALLLALVCALVMFG